MRKNSLIISLFFLAFWGCTYLQSVGIIKDPSIEREVRQGFEEALTLLRQNSLHEASARYLSIAAAHPGHRRAEEARIIGGMLKKVVDGEAENSRLRSQLIKLEEQLNTVEELKKENLELKARIERLNNSLKDLSRIEEEISKEKKPPPIKDKR